MSGKLEVFSIGIAMEEDTPKVYVYLRKRIPIPETYKGLPVVTRVIGRGVLFLVGLPCLVAPRL